MFWLKWRRTIIVLLAANLVFLTLLEVQRQTIWDSEAKYLHQIRVQTESSEKNSRERFDAMFGQVMEMNSHAYNVAVANKELSDTLALMIKELEELIKTQSTANQNPAR